MEYIDHDWLPVPLKFEDAVARVISYLGHEDRRAIRHMENAKAARAELHHTLGRRLRNEWKLWVDNQNPDVENELSSDMALRFEVSHPDDLTGLMLGAAVALVRDEPFDVIAESARYKQHWQQMEKDKS